MTRRTSPAVIAAVSTPTLMDHLLEKTSRTFALTVPLLPEPTRCEVTVAYLLFRVADTLEDATLSHERVIGCTEPDHYEKCPESNRHYFSSLK